ncbi:hypothetical protein EC973_007225 [Apophysomyces ossiformis]|uniref:F-box domain-containing protein n=1 Tax=Apophysomyces ossiformis TaxID=679940 RepID=A0A8H7BVG3_9FUNG|nr:hypothetical protein EC973_007225 [Apophysomyces ossiformis]
MSTCASRLPYEVWKLIAPLLQREDVYNCALACKEWYACFITFLLDEVGISGRRELDRLCGMLQKSGLGHHIRTLKLDRFNALEDKVQELQRMCPRVRSLCLGRTLSEVWERASFPGYAATTVRLFHAFAPQVTGLTLNACAFRPKWHSCDDLSFLRSCPHLKYLCVLSIDELRIASLELIHAFCPQLEDLELEGAYLRDATYEDAEAVAQVRPMRKIRLSFSTGWCRYQTWLRAFAFKYPNLEFLELDNRHGIISLRREDEELRLQEQRSFQLLAHYCHKLRHIRTNHVSLDPRLFESLNSYQTQLDTLYLHNLWRHGRKTTLAALDCGRDTLHTFSLTIPGSVEKEELLPLLGACNQLTHLKLADVDGFGPKEYQISEILYYCRALKTLKVRHLTIVSFDEEDVAKSHHPLESLIMKQVMFDQETLDSIRNCCPNLQELSLIGCSRLECTDNRQLHIQLPEHRLRSVILQDIHCCCCVDRIKYFLLIRSNEESWFHVRHVKSGPKFLPVTKMFTGNELDLLKQAVIDPSAEYTYTKKLRSSDGKAFSWSFEDLVRGYLSIYCLSLDRLVVDDARLV